MRKATIREYESLAEKLANYVGVMDYRFKNLCIKADPVALLPIKVLVDGEVQNLEKCASIGKDNDYQFMIFPNYDEEMIPIVKGIAESHPEFKIEGKSISVDSVDSEGNPKDVEVRYLLVTMPEVNDDRYKVLKDGVDVIYQDCKVQMEGANTLSKPKFAQLAAGETKEDLDTLDQELDKLNKQWNDQRDSIHKAKLKDIEEAHNKWLAGQAEIEKQRQESEDATGEEAAHSMKMTQENQE